MCKPMDALLAALRACAEPTRLRLLALAARGAFCVVESVEILGQSQPRLSRHLKLLCDAGVLERVREGPNVWFGLPPDAGLVQGILDRLPEHDPVLEADRRAAARVVAERARIASEVFNRQGADWDEMRALGLPAAEVETALLAQLPADPLGRLLDIGTGTGRLLELLGPRVRSGLGIDASRAMVALARARLSRPGLGHMAVRQADMYRLPLSGPFDLVVLQMVLHYAEDPAAVLAEAARTVAPGGTVIVVELAGHDRVALTERLAHRWPGFTDGTMAQLISGAGLHARPPQSVPGPLEVRIWAATPQPAATPSLLTQDAAA